MSERKKLTPKQIVEAIVQYHLDVYYFPESDSWGVCTNDDRSFAEWEDDTFEKAVTKAVQSYEEWLAKTRAAEEEQQHKLEALERSEYERLKAKYG